MADRRQVLARGALLTLGLGIVGAQPALALSPYAFKPSSRPMIYARKLTRSLAGGGVIAVERQFEITFAAKADGGYAVSGKQIDVSVDVPAPLAALAEIERNRIEVELFPIELDARGLIVSSGSVSAHEATKQAVAQAMAMAEGEKSISDPVLFRQFLQQVQQSASKMMSHLPKDLFAPSTEPVVSRRELSLPGDLTGQIEITYESAANPSNGLLTTAQRDVTTRIGEDSRTAQEAWSLRPA